MGKIKLQSFEILLDKHDGAYQPGDSVTGKCVIAIEGELTLSQLQMTMTGKAKTKWKEQSGINRRNVKTYKESITYLDYHYNFIRNRNYQNALKI